MLFNTLTFVLLITGGIVADNVDDLCHDIVSKYDCNHFTLKSLCGSDGNFYPTECDFAKAHCQHRHLTIVSEGNKCTGGQMTTPVATSDNFKRVCQVIVSQYDCSKFPYKVLCGSDGIEYYSECAFTKAHCQHPYLSIASEGGPCHTSSVVKTTVMTTTSKPVPTTTMDAVTSTTKPNPITTMGAETTTAESMSTTQSPASTTIGGSQTVPTVHTDIPSSGQPVTHKNTDHATMTASNQQTTGTIGKTMTTQPDTTVAMTTVAMTTVATTTTMHTPPPTPDPILCQVLLAASCPPDGPKVCGTDTKTYANACALEKQSCQTPEVQHKSDGECPTSFNVICRAVLEHPCSGESKPVCGSNGQQYNNLCEHQKAKCLDPNLTISHSGPCV